MSCILNAQLSRDEIKLFEAIHARTYLAKTPAQAYGKAYDVLNEFSVNPAPAWVLSMLEDATTRNTDVFKKNATEHFSLKAFFDTALNAYMDLFFMFDQEPPAIKGLKDKGYNTDAAHMRWAHILVEETQEALIINDEQDVHNVILYHNYAKHLDIDLIRFESLLDEMWEKKIAALTVEQYINWYAQSRDKLNTGSEEHQDFIERVKYLHSIAPITEEKGKHHNVFTELHPRLRDQGYKMAMEVLQP